MPISYYVFDPSGHPSFILAITRLKMLIQSHCVIKHLMLLLQVIHNNMYYNTKIDIKKRAIYRIASNSTDISNYPDTISN